MHLLPKKIKSWGLILVFFWAQVSLFAQVSKDVLQLADSLAKETLEKEGLFTVLGGLKPISTVEHFQIPIDSITKNLLSPEEASLQIQMLHESLNLLSDENIGFAIIPFKAVVGDTRSFQILVYNKNSIQRTIQTYPEFFIKRGVLPSIDPQSLLMMVEFEEKIDRFRAYGYLFGYPRHAVDFFVEAAKHEESTGEFVTRSFFQIPVASSETGRFVYTLPENQEPSADDMELKRKAGEILETFKRIRDEQLSLESDYPFLGLLKFIRENLSECSCLEGKSFKFPRTIN
jgi:hypothetical protein